jgi:hypothetical protein
MSFAKEFSDVKNTKFKEPVNILTTIGIIDGYSDGTYRPNNTVTRAEMAKLIIVSLGKEEASEALKNEAKFSDVKKGSWAAGYINYAANQGIIKGYPDGSFKPSQTVTYAEAATMLLRTLNYTKELESKKYPTEYMSVANEAGILKNVSANSAKDGASRGYVAYMVLNTLKGNIRKIVSTNTNGTITYGDGDILLEKTFSNYKYVKEGLVYDIDFDEGEIVIKDTKNNNRKFTAVYDNEEDLKKMYLRKVECIYNSSNKEFLTFGFVDNYKVVTVDVEDIDNKYIYDTKDNEYKYDEVLLYNINNYGEAEIAYIVIDKSDEVISTVLEGTPNIYVGMVDDPDVTVSKNKGLIIIKPDGKSSEYAYSSKSSSKTKTGEVLIYTFDNDERVIVKERIASSDAFQIEELTSTTIKLKKKETLTLSTDTEYYVYRASDDDFEEIKLKDIDDEFDTAYIANLYGVYYIVSFEDSVNADDIVSKLSVSEAKEKLQDTVKIANRYLKKESSYSVETFEPLKSATEEANTALKNSTSAARLELLEKRISQAIDNLESSTSSDKELRSAYKTLQNTITDAESKKQADYTKDSYNKLSTALKTAKAIKLETTTVSKVESANSELRKAINLLVTTAANTELQNALNELKSNITKAEALYKKKDDYTTTSINSLNTALTNAKKLDQSSATLSEIKTQTNNLEVAISKLVLKNIDSYSSALKSLQTKYKDVIAIKSDSYTEDSYKKFSTEVTAIKETYKGIKDVATVETLSAAEVQNEIKKVNDLITKIDSAKKLLVSSSLEKARERLKAYIDEAKAIKEADWKSTTMTFAELQTLISNAEKVYNDSTKTEADIKPLISDFAINLE